MEPSTPRRAHPLRWAVVATAAASIAVPWVAHAATPAGTGSVVPAAAAAPAAPAADWQTVWEDDFTGSAGSQPSTSDWTYDLGHSYPGGPGDWGTGEVQSYTNSPSNISLDGSGDLKITPLRDSSGAWTSSRIETNRSDFAPPSGGQLRIESRIQMPNVTGDKALGYWPAFWALGSTYRGNYWNWPGIGEIDIMENVNGINKVWSTLHCGWSPGGPCNETIGIGNNVPCPGTSCQAGFHTYTFEWDKSVSPNQMRWYVDGQLFHTVSESQVPADVWSQATSHGYYVLLNVAMGGAFPDPVAGRQTPTPDTEPGHPMLVDYVKVASKAGSGSSSTTTTSPTSTTTSPTSTTTSPTSTTTSPTSTTTSPTSTTTSPTSTTTSPTSTTTSPASCTSRYVIKGARDAYAPIRAESYNRQNGVGIEASSDTGGGCDVTGVGNGDWTAYRKVDFGSTAAHGFAVRVASGAAGGVSGLVQVRLDSPTGAVVGDLAVANTGGWQTWRTVPGNLSAVTGVHTVYLTFSSGQPADFVNVGWVTFTH